MSNPTLPGLIGLALFLSAPAASFAAAPDKSGDLPDSFASVVTTVDLADIFELHQPSTNV
jgi:hypothetical protein